MLSHVVSSCISFSGLLSQFGVHVAFRNVHYVGQHWNPQLGKLMLVYLTISLVIQAAFSRLSDGPFEWLTEVNWLTIRISPAFCRS